MTTPIRLASLRLLLAILANEVFLSGVISQIEFLRSKPSMAFMTLSGDVSVFECAEPAITAILAHESTGAFGVFFDILEHVL